MELQVEGRNLEIRKSWQDKIDEEKKKLDRHHAGLVHSLRITIEETAHHKEGGYELGMVAGIPNDTVVVKKKGIIPNKLAKRMKMKSAKTNGKNFMPSFPAAERNMSAINS